jgi:hypothetical protein
MIVSWPARCWPRTGLIESRRKLLPTGEIDATNFDKGQRSIAVMRFLSEAGAVVCAVGIGGLLAASPLSAADGKKCDVTVDRGYSNGTYEVTRQELANGDCVCYIQTGASPQSVSIENRIADLRENRQCSDATAMVVPSGKTAAATAVPGKFTLIAFAAAGAAGVAVAASGSSDSPESP